MEKKVTAEGEKQEELFNKFMAYCNNKQAIEQSIEDTKEKIPQLESDIKEQNGLKAQLDAEIIQHKNDREEAKEAIAKGTAVRDKEAKSFAAESSEEKANIEGLNKAIPAIEKGMGAEFLQTG